MNRTLTTVVYFNDTDHSGFADDADLGAFEDVNEGDYITVVYETPSNGGCWHRAMGTIQDLREFEGRLDDLWFTVEDTDREDAGQTAHLHINSDTGDYIFTDDVGSDDTWGIKKVALTPGKEVTA